MLCVILLYCPQDVSDKLKEASDFDKDFDEDEDLNNKIVPNIDSLLSELEKEGALKPNVLALMTLLVDAARTPSTASTPVPTPANPRRGVGQTRKVM